MASEAACRAVASYCGVTVDLANHKITAPTPAKLPFVEGFTNHTATARYIARLFKDAGLYGGNVFEESAVDQWVEFVGLEVSRPASYLRAPAGKVDKKLLERCAGDLTKVLGVLNKVLLSRTYLASEHVTVADVLLATELVDVFTAAQRKSAPNVGRWLDTVCAVFGLSAGAASKSSASSQSSSSTNKENAPKNKKDKKESATPAKGKAAGSAAPAPKKGGAPPAAKDSAKDAQLEKDILAAVNQGPIADSSAFASTKNLAHDVVVGALKSLAADELLKLDVISREVFSLTDEGEEMVKKGASAEMQVFNAAASGVTQSALAELLGATVAKAGFSAAMKQKWVSFDKASQTITRATDSVTDTVFADLKKVKAGGADKAVVDALKRRKLASTTTVKSFRVEKGENFSLERKKMVTDLTADMIKNKSWQEQTFKPLNFNALGKIPAAGAFHPLLKVRKEFREIFFELGFEEMPTNNYVESSFWNFDALFQPQSHPARDMHDTFFLKNPENALTIPQDYMNRVKNTHEKGGKDLPAKYNSHSFGYNNEWKESEARKNLLRTHTTAVSSRMLQKLAEEGFQPKKYFSIDRVFRNEMMDATHLCEFHQIEGVVADYNLTLGDLMGILELFFKKLGIKQLRFKPTYNPYTEPSMEVFSWHEGLKKWVEIGNSGVFRPEMLRPMGLPENVSIIAWGLSLERPTMIKYGISNIRDLFGHHVDLDMVRTNPICRLDKN